MIDDPGFRIIDLSPCTAITAYGADAAAVVRWWALTGWQRLVVRMRAVWAAFVAAVRPLVDAVAAAMDAVACWLAMPVSNDWTERAALEYDLWLHDE